METCTIQCIPLPLIQNVKIYPKRGNQNISHYRCSSVYGWWKEGALVLNKREVQGEVFIQGGVRGCRINKNVSYDFREVLTRFLYKVYPLIVTTNMPRFHPCPKEFTQLWPNLKIDVNSSLTDNFIKENRFSFLSPPPLPVFLQNLLVILSILFNAYFHCQWGRIWWRKCLIVLHGPHFVLFLWLSTRRTVEINGLRYEIRLWALLAILGGRICIDIVQDDRNIGIMRFPSAGRGSRRLLCTCLEIVFSFGGLLITRTWGSRYLCRQVC